jgi:hypothetical protein
MLKISVLNSRQFLNDLHIQCVTEVKNLTENNHPDVLGIAAQFDDFVIWYNREKDAFEFIRRSQITAAKDKADHARDLAYMGLYDFVKSATNHYYTDVAVAARRLLGVIETFNHPVSLTRLSYDAETASIRSLIDNIKAYPEDVTKLNMQGWITALQNKNDAFEALALEYIEEVVGKPEYNMLHARRGVENAMRTMFHCIDALIVMNGETPYTPYVTALNAIIKHYNDVYAIHLGRYEANKDKEEPVAE